MTTIHSLIERFSEREEIQVLDQTTGLWTRAEILAFRSDWVIKVKWSDYNQTTSPPTDVSVPCGLRTSVKAVHRWPIRKWTAPDSTTLPRSARRSAVKEKDLPRPLKKFIRGDEAFFVKDDDEETIKRGWVYANDPFREEMQIWEAVSDEDEPDTVSGDPVFVGYKSLRPQPHTRARYTDGDETSTDDEATHISEQSLKRVRLTQQLGKLC